MSSIKKKTMLGLAPREGSRISNNEKQAILISDKQRGESPKGQTRSLPFRGLIGMTTGIAVLAGRAAFAKFQVDPMSDGQ